MVLSVITVRRRANISKNKHIHNSFTWFIFNLPRRKIYQINTVLYNIQWFTHVAFRMQKPLFGVVTIDAGMQNSLNPTPPPPAIFEPTLLITPH